MADFSRKATCIKSNFPETGEIELLNQPGIPPLEKDIFYRCDPPCS
jgi:hypothetical protein